MRSEKGSPETSVVVTSLLVRVVPPPPRLFLFILWGSRGRLRGVILRRDRGNGVCCFCPRHAAFCTVYPRAQRRRTRETLRNSTSSLYRVEMARESANSLRNILIVCVPLCWAFRCGAIFLALTIPLPACLPV